ncbi:hypothetical protein ACFU6I_46210 [Streptomyces sp. NPDC057486]|uniref:hypothetical protein n=1 Tax=Streptomyces sp. NPDC057486 TaxID=3346145 RepID=UPI0036BBFBAE
MPPAPHGVVDAIALETAAAEDLSGLHAGEGVLDTALVDRDGTMSAFAERYARFITAHRTKRALMCI